MKGKPQSRNLFSKYYQLISKLSQYKNRPDGKQCYRGRTLLRGPVGTGRGVRGLHRPWKPGPPIQQSASRLPGGQGLPRLSGKGLAAGQQQA